MPWPDPPLLPASAGATATGHDSSPTAGSQGQDVHLFVNTIVHVDILLSPGTKGDVLFGSYFLLRLLFRRSFLCFNLLWNCCAFASRSPGRGIRNPAPAANS